MASYSFPKNFTEDNSGKKFTKMEKDFLKFLLYQYGDIYTDDLLRDEDGVSEWMENLEAKL